MVKTKEKLKAMKKALADEGVQKKDKKAKKKELLELLKNSLTDESDEPQAKIKKKQKAASASQNGQDLSDLQSESRVESFGDDELEKLLYKPMPKKDRKVKLDPRFQEIFDNPEYAGVTRDTDERGALKLVEKSKKKKKKEKEKEKEKEAKRKKKSKPVEESEEESVESQPEVDSEDEETDLEDEWRQMSEDEAPVWEQLEPSKEVEFLDAPTRRLCLKHMQWDRVTPRDIYVLARSFLPASGALHRVTIYPSEEGVAKLPQDERTGPAIVGALDSLAEEAGVTEWPGEGKAKLASAEELEEALSEPKARRLNLCRRYELERLAFFYAILEFDSPETASAVYETIDGTEYEASGCRIDLYFVEDSRQVDKHLCGLADEQAWRAMITTWPETAAQPADDLERYAPPNFVNNALRHTHQFGLSWDETPAERKVWLESLAEVDDIDEEWQEENCPELSRYLAMSDSSEEEEEKERKRQLIRSLLQEADKAEQQKKRRQQRGLRKSGAPDSDSESDSEAEEEVEKVEESRQDEEEIEDNEEEDEIEDNEEEKMETSETEAASYDENNFFKLVAEKRKEKLKKMEQKTKNEDLIETVSDEDLHFGSTKKQKKKKKEEEASASKAKGKPDAEASEKNDKTGKRKRKRLSKLQKAKQKLKEKERPVDPELSLLLSNFKRTTKTPKEMDSEAVAEDPRFASIFKDPKFAKDPGSLVRLSARL